MLTQFNLFKNHPFISAIPSLESLLVRAIPTLQTHLQLIISPALNHSALPVWHNKDYYVSAKDRVCGVLHQLKLVLKSLLAHSAKDPAVKLILQQGIDEGDELLHSFQHQSLVHFLFSHTRQLFKFVRSLTDMFSGIMCLSGDAVLETATAINNTFRQIFSLFDQIEIHLFLRAGYFSELVSLNDHTLVYYADLFTQAVHAQGYAFKADEAFPYYHDVLRMRKNCLAMHPEAGDYTKTFIGQRIHMTKVDIATQSNQEIKTHLVGVAEFQSARLKALNSRLNELQLECHFFNRESGSKRKTIACLQKLIVVLGKSSTTKIQLGGFTYQERELLRQGRTGKLLETFSFASKADILLDLQLVTDRLKRQLTSASFFSSKTAIKEKILALAQLKTWLILPGFSITDAMRELKEANLAAYLTVKNHETELLGASQQTEKMIPEFTKPKKVIGLFGNSYDSVDPFDEPLHDANDIQMDNLRVPLLS